MVILFAIIILVAVLVTNCALKKKQRKILEGLADSSFPTDFKEYVEVLNGYGINISATYEFGKMRFDTKTYDEDALIITCPVIYKSNNIDKYREVSYNSNKAKELCSVLKSINSVKQQRFSYYSEEGIVIIEMAGNENNMTIYGENGCEYEYSYVVDYDELKIEGEYAFMESDGSYEETAQASSYSGAYDAKLKYKGTKGVLICVSEDAMEKFMTSVNNDNQEKLDELL